MGNDECRRRLTRGTLLAGELEPPQAFELRIEATDSPRSHSLVNLPRAWAMWPSRSDTDVRLATTAAPYVQ